MYSQNIKALRTKAGLTQKDLADMLHVTPQAISRWETGEVEPSLDSIARMANIFGVSTDEILDGPGNKYGTQARVDAVATDVVIGELKKEIASTNRSGETKEAIEGLRQEIANSRQGVNAEAVVAGLKEELREEIRASQPKPVLAVCDDCQKPIFESHDMVKQTHTHRSGRSSSTTYSYICRACDKKRKERAHQIALSESHKARVKAFWLGLLAALAVLLIDLIFVPKDYTVWGIVLAVLSYPLVSCLLLKNNFVGETFEEIATWGVVRFPGLIFEWSPEGFAWLIGMKILFWILGFMIGLAAILLAIAVCMVLSVFVWPFALHKSYANPEATDLF